LNATSFPQQRQQATVNMVKKKGKSKRTSLLDKYKIKKRTAETNRKLKKQTRRDAANGKVKHGHKSKKDPGIPNSWPFKQDLLKEIQRTRERQKEIQVKAKEERQTNLRALRDHQAQGGGARTVEELMAQAQQSQADFSAKKASLKEGDDDTKVRHDNSVSAGQQSRRAYLRELRKVIDSSDVILQVLDARDPINSRINPHMEDMIKSRADKKMVLLLNKIDLVPKQVVQDWLTYLRRSVPALAVRADKIVERKTASKKESRGANSNQDDAMSTATSSTSATDVLGMEGLLQLLKNYARASTPGAKKAKTTIVVGVIGYPNVGT
jgi:nuclear GTP-binding protein